MDSRSPNHLKAIDFWYMTSRILVLVLAILCFCCESKKEIPFGYNDLVGEWELVEIRGGLPKPEPLRLSWSALGPQDWKRLTIHPDSTIETREIQMIMTRPDNHRRYTFPDYKFRFRIQQDSLSLFSIQDQQWSAGRKIHRVTRDSLIFKTGRNHFLKYRRALPLPDSLPTFDAIALSSSGCYGVCPIVNIIINSNGNVLFLGERNVDSLGFYKASIGSAQYKIIQDLFRRADIKNIDTNFETGDSDQEEITVTFIKDGKIYKTISDYGGAAPSNLVWACARLRHLHQWIPLTKLSTAELPVYQNLHFFNFLKGNTLCELTQSESFLLWSYLYQGRSSAQQAAPRFRLRSVRNYIWFPENENIDNDPYNTTKEAEISNIQTDGRLYTFFIKGQKPVTIDIGFNFFDHNYDKSCFRPLKEYE